MGFGSRLAIIEGSQPEATGYVLPHRLSVSLVTGRRVSLAKSPMWSSFAPRRGLSRPATRLSTRTCGRFVQPDLPALLAAPCGDDPSAGVKHRHAVAVAFGIIHRDSCAASRSASALPPREPRTVASGESTGHGGTAQRCARKNPVYATIQGIPVAGNPDGGDLVEKFENVPMDVIDKFMLQTDINHLAPVRSKDRVLQARSYL